MNDARQTSFVKEQEVLSSEIEMTEIDRTVYVDFDYEFEGKTEFIVPDMPNIDEDFTLGVIYGSSGSGKSTLLKRFGEEEELTWHRNRSVASHFNDKDDAIERLGAVGLNTVPTWAKPRNVLSNGEGFRADLARRLKDNCVIDEYSSVVNRAVAKSCSVALSKYIKRKQLKNVLLASCHKDILEWLEPDWVYDTDAQKLSRRSLRRPEIKIEIYKSSSDVWNMFAKHHYLTSNLPSIAHCYVAVWDGIIVGFSSYIVQPGWYPPHYDEDDRIAMRECRTVVLPDYQGLGIGAKLSDQIADIALEEGYRYYSKTAHPRMGAYRERSPLWRATITNLLDRSSNQKKLEERRNAKRPGHQFATLIHDYTRVCFSHEFMGENNKTKDPSLRRVKLKDLQEDLFESLN